nr:B-cell receptor CD22-like [Pocillopora verrucosa]
MAKLWGNSEWCPATASLGTEYFQVDFSRPFRVCAVDTQGHHTLSTWFVSSFNITYSLNESTWFTAQQNETNGIFSGNSDGNTVVRNKLSGNWSFVARFLRLIPLTWNAWPCLRMEVYGRELPAIDVRFPRNKTVLEGEQFTLKCLPLGNKNNFNVTWMKKSGNERSFPVAGQNLTVNATRLDTGAYSCEVTNGVEAIVSPIAYVTVWYPPSFIDLKNQTKEIVEGVKMSLQCNVTAANPEPNITWYSATGNDTVLSNAVHLTFSNISRSNSGNYFCVAENGIGPKLTSGMITLNVQYSPSLDTNFPHDESAVEGENVTMNCVVKESNPEPNITWVKLSDRAKVFPSGASLRLRSISKDDEGEYRCLAENGIGEQMMSRIAYLSVEGGNEKGTSEKGSNLVDDSCKRK